MTSTLTQPTLREFYEAHYVHHADLGRRSREKYRSCLRRWERLTGDPPLGDVDNATLAEFRKAMLDAGLKPATVNGTWSTLRAVFRFAGPQEFRNPFGLGLIDRVPAMKRVKGGQSRPYRIPLDDLSRTYAAAEHAVWPITGIPPADIWRCLLTLVYTTGLRRRDLDRLRWDDVDLDNGSFEFTASKTGKYDQRQLHPVAVAHLQRIWRQTETVFHGLTFGENGNVYKTLYTIQKRAKVQRRFTLHDIRRCGASEIERIAPGVGREFLQHAARNVSDISYINRALELDEAVAAMRLPDAFAGAVPPIDLDPFPELTDEEAVAVAVPVRNRGQWEFYPGGFVLAGRRFPVRQGAALWIIRTLVSSQRPLTAGELAKVVNRRRHVARAARPRETLSIVRMRQAVSEARGILRRLLGLPEALDPLPCVQSNPPAWSVYLPDYALSRIATPQPSAAAGE